MVYLDLRIEVYFGFRISCFEFHTAIILRFLREISGPNHYHGFDAAMSHASNERQRAMPPRAKSETPRLSARVG